MERLPAFLLLVWLFLVGIKLLVRRRGDLRLGGVFLAFGLVPALVLRHFFPDVLRGRVVHLLDRDFPALGLWIGLAGLLLGIHLFTAFLSFLRVRSRGEPFLALHRALIKIGLLLVGIPVLLKALNPDLEFEHVLASAAVGTLIFGFALQETLGNLFSGLSLEFENMFRQGEFIRVGMDGPRGTVVEKTWRSTRIVTLDGEMIIVPNNELAKSLVVNYDRPTPQVALRLQIGTSYDDPPVVVKEVIQSVLAAEAEVLTAPPPEIWTRRYDDFAIVYEARYWIRRMRGHNAIADRVNTALWYAFRDRGISIPFPIRTVHHVQPEERRAESARHEEQRLSIEEFLATVEPFAAHARHVDRHFLAQNAVVEALPAGGAVVKKGEVGDAMYVIIEGSCEVLLPGGERKSLERGAFFGEIALLRDQPRTADVVAGPGGAKLVRLGRLAMRGVLARRASLQETLFRTADERILELQAREEVEAPRKARPLTVKKLLRGALRLMTPW